MSETRTITSHEAIHAAWPGQFSITGMGVNAQIEGANPPSQGEIDTATAAYQAGIAATGYIRARRPAYVAGILAAKDFDGTEIDAIGFYMDVVISELRAMHTFLGGYTPTTEFTAVCSMIDTIKADNPKPE